MRKTYTVTTKHPTGYLDGMHEITVTRTPAFRRIPESRYCDAVNLGCSRDYPTKSDEDAIRRFLSEHAMTATSIALAGCPIA